MKHLMCSNHLYTNRFIVLGLIVLSVVLPISCTAGKVQHQNTIQTPMRWTGTWACSPQLVEPHNMPPEPGLSNSTIRQIVRVSIGGTNLRLKFSNEFSKSPVTMQKVMVAASTGGSNIDSSTITEIQFNGKSMVTMAPGSAIISDPFTFNLKPRMDVAITICFGETSPDVTGHPGSRTTSYLLSGDMSSSARFSGAVPTDHWYVINGIDVKTPVNAGTIAIIGNSITDGRGSGTNKQNRWPDILSERLLKNPATQNVGVLNMGVGGNCVLKACLGPSALDRFDRDILNQSGVRWVIIFEAINDIGGTQTEEAAAQVARELIAAYETMIDKAHARGLKVYGATIAPFSQSFYYRDFREAARKTVNTWIRESGRFDAVIDFDHTLQNPADPMTIKPEAHTGDYLHPNEAGYVLMGESINLKLFEND